MRSLVLFSAVAAAGLLAFGQASAQVDPHAAHRTAAPPALQTAPEPHAGHDMTGMTGFYGRYPMAREASGTAWQPESVGMHGLHATRGEWSVMGHALINIVYTDQGGPRGDEDAFVSGMIMGMASRRLGEGTLGIRVMLSPDPFMGRSGYPLLLAVGETADGEDPLIDRQHPHELISELAASYSLPIGANAGLFGYAAVVGEPAFGPPAFPHRASGMDNPLAPISHHWLDSTHVSFGVLTGGLVVGDVKLEGSGFRGREPDEDRYDIEAPRLDSWAVRATWNPGPNWSLQASYADQSSPEQLEPEVDVRRTSLSAMYSRPLFRSGTVHATLAWGRRNPDEGDTVDAWLAEAALRPNDALTLFARAERVEQNELLGHGHGDGDHHDEAAPLYDVGQLTLGAVYDWTLRPGVRVGLGASFQAYDVPAALDTLYGGSPTGTTVFLRLKAM